MATTTNLLMAIKFVLVFAVLIIGALAALALFCYGLLILGTHLFPNSEILVIVLVSGVFVIGIKKLLF